MFGHQTTEECPLNGVRESEEPRARSGLLSASRKGRPKELRSHKA